MSHWYQQLLWFIVAVGVLVTIHEFGHYWVARRLGFKVLRFSVGFGKPLWKKVAGADQTEYVIAAIPLGGYVKLLDEREGNVPEHELHRSFTRKPVWQRVLVLVAGAAFNILFAILVLWGMFWSQGVTEMRPVVGEVAVSTPAASAGLVSGDEIIGIDGRPVRDQQGVIFGLLDKLSGEGRASLTVKSGSGVERRTEIVMADSAQRRRMTEPALLFDTLGFHFWMPPVPAIIGTAEEGGPAALAGLKPGDRITAVNEQPVSDFRELVKRISAVPGESVSLTYERAGLSSTLNLIVGAEEVEGRSVGRIRVTPATAGIKYPDEMLRHVSLSPLAALGRAVQEAWDMTVLQARLFARMLTGQVSLKNLSGPLSIAEFAGDSAAAGVSSFLSFLVLISLSLGFLNLLPIPILDGGQIVFQLIEGIKGSPLSDRTQAIGQQLGIVLLLMLMGVALFNDFARQFG